MAEPTPNLWPHLYRGRVRTHKRLARAAKLLRLTMEGHLIDQPHKGDAAQPLVYAAIILVEKALKIQLETESYMSWKPEVACDPSDPESSSDLSKPLVPRQA